MSKGVRFWLDSGANIHSCNEQFLTWKQLGFTEEEWDAMSEEEQEAFAREISWARMDWGFAKDDT